VNLHDRGEVRSVPRQINGDEMVPATYSPQRGSWWRRFGEREVGPTAMRAMR
jgi:hypothetical protein